MKDKKKIIIPVVVAVIVIIAVVIIGITTLKKKAETTKIDIDTKSYVADLSKYIEKIDDTKDVEETKESISSEIVTLQRKYPNSESVSLSSVELLNTLSSSKAQSTKGLKDTLQGALAKVEQTVDKLIYKSKVEPNVVTIASSTVCEKYGSSSKYCLDGTSKKLNAYIYVNDENSKNWVLLLHGNNMNGRAIYSALGKIYEQNNFNVIAPDFRGQGKSDGKVAMSYLESLDSYDWIKYLNENYNVNNLVIHGVSLGGATTIQLGTNQDFGDALRNNYHVKGFIDDCGYTSMTAVIKGMISSSDTSSLSATLKNSGIDISEFKNSFKTIMNSLNIPITNSEVNSIISGKTSIDEFENKIKNEYGTEYEESKKILNSVDLSQCGENYENCIKEAYNYVKDNNIINNNTSTISESDKEKINSFINSYINKRDISSTLVDTVIEKLIMNLLDVGLTEQNFETYQNSFSTGRNFKSSDKVLIIHGDKDTMVRPDNADRVEAKAQEANTKLTYKWKVSGKPHAFIVAGMEKDNYYNLVGKYLKCIENDNACQSVSIN